MRYALDEKEKRKEVSYSGEEGVCKTCKSIVKGRKGEQRIKHWYHQKSKDCDNWNEPITEWHINWQNHFPEKNREFILRQDGKIHRADIRLENGLIIEVQNSPIRLSEIEKREKFYGKDNLIWILNGESLTKNSELKKIDFLYEHMLAITIPKRFLFVEGYDYNFLIKKILKSDHVQLFLGEKSEVLIEKNTLILKSTELPYLTNIDLIEVHQKTYITSVFEQVYGRIRNDLFFRDINISYKEIKESFTERRLEKRYWRKFIDVIKCPVYIDNLNGLRNSEIYDYHNKCIVDKDFLIQEFKTLNNP